MWRHPGGSHAHSSLVLGGSWGAAAGFKGQVLAPMMVVMVMVFAVRSTVTVF